MKRKILIFLCFIMCVVSLASVSAADEITEINDNACDLVSVPQEDVVNDLSLDDQGADLESQTDSDNDNLGVNASLKETEINVQNVTMYYKDGRRFSGNLADSDGNPLAGMPVFVQINGVNRTFTTDGNGGFSFAINLIPGTYPVTVEFPGASGYLPSVAWAYVEVKQTLYSFDLIKMYGSDLKYVVLVSQNRTLDNVKLSFNINGRTYYRTTGLLGTAGLPINLIPGDYVITTERLDTGERLSNTIHVIPLLSENKDVDMYYKNGSYYSVKVSKQDGKSSSAGEKVTFNINGILYTREANESGYANLNINLAPGKYRVTAEYCGYRVSNDITVKPVISASDLTKTYGSPDPFVAKLVDGHGNPASDKTVKFNINGVFYYAKTDGNGTAKLNITLMSGEYIISSTSPNGNTISNKIVVKDAK